MFLRNLMLAIGGILVFAGIGLSFLWLSQSGGGPEPAPTALPQQQAPVVRREAMLEAAHPLP
jgi:hypothetical protein